MEPESVNPSWPDRLGHGSKMSDGVLLRTEVTERVDGIERRIEGFLHGEVAHVCHPCRFLHTMLAKPGVAIIDRFGVKIKTGRKVTTFRHAIQKAARSASWFEHSLGFALHVLLESRLKEPILGRPIATENEIIINGIIVNVVFDSFHEQVATP